MVPITHVTHWEKRFSYFKCRGKSGNLEGVIGMTGICSKRVCKRGFRSISPSLEGPSLWGLVIITVGLQDFRSCLQTQLSASFLDLIKLLLLKYKWRRSWASSQKCILLNAYSNTHEKRNRRDIYSALTLSQILLSSFISFNLHKSSRRPILLSPFYRWRHQISVMSLGQRHTVHKKQNLELSPELAEWRLVFYVDSQCQSKIKFNSTQDQF